jgi:hypothetical protein
MSGKNSVREAAMSIGHSQSQEADREPAERTEDRFMKSIDGFSPGILAHPKLYLKQTAAARLVPIDDQERIVQFGDKDPLPEYTPKA